MGTVRICVVVFFFAILEVLHRNLRLCLIFLFYFIAVSAISVRTKSNVSNQKHVTKESVKQNGLINDIMDRHKYNVYKAYIDKLAYIIIKKLTRNENHSRHNLFSNGLCK